MGWSYYRSRTIGVTLLLIWLLTSIHWYSLLMCYVGGTWVQHIIDTDTNTNIYPYWFLSNLDLLHKAETWIKNFPTTVWKRFTTEDPRTEKIARQPASVRWNESQKNANFGSMHTLYFFSLFSTSTHLYYLVIPVQHGLNRFFYFEVPARGSIYEFIYLRYTTYGALILKMMIPITPPMIWTNMRIPRMMILWLWWLRW